MYPLEVGCKMMIVSGTGGGKTSWASKLVRFKEEMFPDEPPRRTMFCYSIWQEIYQELQQEFPEIIFKNGLPSKDELMELSGGDHVEHSLLLIDDMITELCESKDMEQLFTTLSHHRRISVLAMTQNIFYQGKCARTISLQTWYFALLYARRDIKQIKNLASQIYGGGSTKPFMEAYFDTQKDKYGYLFVDISPHGDKKHMLRTSIFPDESPTVVYAPKF